MQILLRFVAPVPFPEQALRDFQRHVQINYGVRRGKPQFIILKIANPIQIGIPLRTGKLCHLVHHVRGGIPVGDDQAAACVVTAPVAHIACKAVHRVEGAGREGVDLLRMRAELAAEIHLHQRGGLLLIIWKRHPFQSHADLRERLAQQSGLRGLSAAVKALDHNQPAAHGCSSRFL